MSRRTIADEIKRTLSMERVVQQYGYQPNKGGFIACPFHQEKTPSLKVFAEPGRGFHCYGCNTGGSVIDFVMVLFGLNLQDAMYKLNEDFALGLLVNADRLSYRERRELARECRELDKARRQEAEEIERAKANCHQALDLFCACDLILLNAPAWSDDWCRALKYKSTAEYRLDKAEIEVILISERKRNSNTGLDSQ